MDPVTPFDWTRMFIGENDALFYLEIVFRVVVIYVYTVALVRYMGKRGRQHLSPFEYVVVIALGSATGDVLFYPEVPILYAFLVIFLIVMLSQLLAALQFRSSTIQKLTDGQPQVVIRNGTILHHALKHEELALCELHSLLRNKGCLKVSDVALGILELDGTLSLFSQEEVESAKGSSLLNDVC